MKALKNELMQELKKSRDEAQQLRQTVEEQQKQFGAQQDIITRQQAQIQGLIVAKEAAEVARQKQEINLIEAKRETEKAIDDGKEKENLGRVPFVLNRINWKSLWINSYGFKQPYK